MRIYLKKVIVFVTCLLGFKSAVYYYRLQFPTSLQDCAGVQSKREIIPWNTIEMSKDGHIPQHKTSQAATVKKKKENEANSVDTKSSHHKKTYFVGENTPDDILRLKRPDYLQNYKNPCWYEAGNNTVPKRLRCLPYFRVIGVDKCGTTDLWYRLTKHPDIVRPQAVMGKETHWWPWRRFGFDIWIRNKPIRHFDWYLQHFDSPSNQIEKHVISKNGSSFHPLITGEGSPTEFWDFTGWNLIPQNKERTPLNAILTPNCLHHLTPDLKSIVIVRNPTDRAYSDYLFLDQFRPIVNLSATGFHHDVTKSIEMVKNCISSNTLQFCLYNKDLHIKMPVRLIPGMYDLFLSKWLQVFPSEQILVLRNEDYSKNIKHYLKAVFKFLNLSSLSTSEVNRISSLPRVFEKTARAKSVGPMLNQTRVLLDAFYKRHNEMLSSRLKDSKYLWES